MTQKSFYLESMRRRRQAKAFSDANLEKRIQTTRSKSGGRLLQVLFVQEITAVVQFNALVMILLLGSSQAREQQARGQC